MRIGVVRELTPGESRVALTPHAVHELSRAGHRVLVELGAGEESAISDEEYAQAGAKIVGDASEVYGEAELMTKIYGPLPEEQERLRPGRFRARRPYNG
ncbi:MAG: hypothetical protein L0G70_03265, partial [Rubrobacter sp.]|nr:hypothetical protein [Rubrobacter sp.]